MITKLIIVALFCLMGAIYAANVVAKGGSPGWHSTISRAPRPCRRPRSSSRAPTASHLNRIGASSIMPPSYPGSPKTGIPNS